MYHQWHSLTAQGLDFMEGQVLEAPVVKKRKVLEALDSS